MFPYKRTYELLQRQRASELAMASRRGISLVLFLAYFFLLAISNNIEARPLHAEGHSARTLLEQPRPLSSASPLGFFLQVNSMYHQDTPSLAFNEEESSIKVVMPLIEVELDDGNPISKPSADDIPISETGLRSPDEDIPVLSILQDQDLLSSIPALLNQSGLPIGLLPSSVASYAITTYGDFIVSLQEPCYVDFDYEVYYAQTISGRLSYGTITNLSGIQAKEAFFWVPITAIRTDIPNSGFIYFNIGPITKKLPINQFETIPTCKAKSMAL